MSGQDARDVIAEALYVRANHPVPENEARTAWRDYAPDNLTRLRYLHMADAALDGLTAADFTVVELPEPDDIHEGTEDENGRAVWSTWPGVVTYDDGEIHVVGVSTTTDDVRAAGQALLAAVARAEAGEVRG